MAQYWFDITEWSDLSKLTLLDPSDPHPPTFITHEGEDVLEVDSGCMGFTLNDIPSVSDCVIAVELYMYDVGPTDTDRRRVRGPAVRVNSDEQLYIVGRRGPVTSFRINRYLDGIGNAVVLDFSALDIWSWTALKAEGDAFSGYAWLGDIADMPGAPAASAVDATFTSGLIGWGRADYSGASYYVRKIAVGTDGDPAPTGPLSTTEAFALRHNPRTNKFIPVLSSPTVTDIGANCVRPRVTKGY